LTDEGLIELGRRLDETESLEDRWLSQRNWIAWLVSPPGRKGKRGLVLKYDNLPKDPKRVNNIRLRILEKEAEEIATRLVSISNRAEILMCREGSEDYVSNLKERKAHLETDLERNQAEIHHLLSDC
jgi:hypothetical protein